MLSFLRNKNNFLLKRFFNSTPVNKGYIVLVPEIGEDENSADSLIKPDGLLHFNGLTIEICMAAIAKQSAVLEEVIREIQKDIEHKNDQLNVLEDIFLKIERNTLPLETTWGIAKTIYFGNSTLMPTKSYMSIHERAKRARASKYSNETIFNFIKNYFETNEVKNPIEGRLIKKFLLEGNLNGLCLTKEKQKDLENTKDKLGKERTMFKNKVNSSIGQFTHTIMDYSLVRDFPMNLLEATSTDPNYPTKGPWKITLQQNILDEFLKYCPDRMERWNLWQANVRKASGSTEKNLDNSTHLEKIRSLRKEQAQLLGFKNFAEMSMETKMIKSVHNAKETFLSLLKHAGPIQQTQLDELQDFALQCDFQKKLEIYDIPYWERKFLKSAYDWDENVIREYFTLPAVLNGLFEISEKKLNIKFEERKNVEVWHSGVKYFDIIDLNVSSTKPVGGFYLDCYSRENQQPKNFGWMVGIRNKSSICSMNPLAALIFNFVMPVHNKPYLLTLPDIEIIFKNFGTALQHLLTQVNCSELAGLPNEWDASQICGNVFINIANNEEHLSKMASHYQTNEPLPDHIIKNMKHRRTTLSGFKLCRELYFCDLDLELNISEEFWLDVVKKMWPIYNITTLDKMDSHPCSMSEIFSGDWGAAYFSNLYSKIVAADIYNALENDKNSIAGVRFKENYLYLGSSVDSNEVFRKFRGRDVTTEALLKSLDLFKVSQATEC